MPKTFNQALKSTESKFWNDAIEKEWNAMFFNKVFEFVDRPHKKNMVKSKWVFDKKINEKGEVTRYKARLCAKGFSQVSGVDYHLTYAPTIDRTTINVILTYCLANNLIVKQFDVETAFLQAPLQEDIYMEIPDGFSDRYPKNQVIHLLRAIYGLKQSSKAFNDKLTKVLTQLGWVQLKSDLCLFKRNAEILAAFVDDCIVGVTNESSYQIILEEIAPSLKLVDLGDIKHFLKIKVDYDVDKQYCKLSQPVFIKEILEGASMNECAPKYTVLDPHTQLCKGEESEGMKTKPFREILGQLIYLATCTRPDIYYAVVKLSQFNNCFNSTHWNQLMHLLCYLKATENDGLVLSPGDLRIRTYTDADWGGNIDNRRSTSGILILLGNSVVLWKSKTQKTVAHSTMEAEFKALASGVSFSICIMALKGENYKGRSKHNEIHFHIVKEIIESSDIVLNYVQTGNNVADMLTKVLTRDKLQFLKQKLNIGV